MDEMRIHYVYFSICLSAELYIILDYTLLI